MNISQTPILARVDHYVALRDRQDAEKKIEKAETQIMKTMTDAYKVDLSDEGKQLAYSS